MFTLFIIIYFLYNSTTQSTVQYQMSEKKNSLQILNRVTNFSIN